MRVVLALHTYVFLYFFNMLPNMAKDLAVGLDEWRALIARSMTNTIWPACLCGLGGTLIAPVLMPTVFGPPYVTAVRPFQVAIWMIPVAWFSGHFRFSLIAAGQQRWEFAASAGSAVVTVTCAVIFGRIYGSFGAAIALLSGGLANLVLAMIASHRFIGPVPMAPGTLPALAATAVCLAIGFLVTTAAGPLAGAVAGCLVFLVVAAQHDNELVRLVRGAIRARR